MPGLTPPRHTPTLPVIGKGDASRRRPSHTTGHTGPYHGGSTELGWGGRVDSGKTERLEIVVA